MQYAISAQPDLFFVSKMRKDIITDHVCGAPDLVVEVMSPPPRLHPRIGQLQDRIGYLAHYGARECWLIHQLARSIEVLVLNAYGVAARQTFSGIERIQSTVLGNFGVSPDLLACW